MYFISSWDFVLVSVHMCDEMVVHFIGLFQTLDEDIVCKISMTVLFTQWVFNKCHYLCHFLHMLLSFPFMSDLKKNALYDLHLFFNSMQLLY